MDATSSRNDATSEHFLHATAVLSAICGTIVRRLLKPAWYAWLTGGLYRSIWVCESIGLMCYLDEPYMLDAVRHI